MTDKVTAVEADEEFYCPPEFDEKVADEGVWFAFTSPAGHELGEFHCQLIHPESVNVKNFTRRNAKRIDQLQRLKGEAADDGWLKFMADTLVELSVDDWKVNNGKGEPIPFSKEKALQYFSNKKFAKVTMFLHGEATNVQNYQPDGDPLKN